MSIPSKIDLNTFLDALRWQESSHRDDVPDGDGGEAFGPYQMHEIMVKEANLLAGTNYTHEDARDPEKAHDMAKKLYYAFDKYLRGRGVEPKLSHFLAMWNGGRTGYQYVDGDAGSIKNFSQEKKDNLDEYIRKFKEDSLPYILNLSNETAPKTQERVLGDGSGFYDKSKPELIRRHKGDVNAGVVPEPAGEDIANLPEAKGI